MRVFGRIIPMFLCIVTLFLLTLFVVTTPSQASTDDSTQSITNKSPQIFSEQPNVIEPSSYWSEKKLKNAIPLDEVNPKTFSTAENSDSEKDSEGGVVSHPVFPDSTDIGPLAVVPSTSGKVFFSYGGKDYVCSGSAINNDYNNLVMTAAHCVHDGPDGDWHENLAFAPAYYKGLSQYGLWEYQTARTFNGWINNRNYDYDQAFFTVRQKNGKNLINTVGGNGLSYNYGQEQSDVRISGYPAGDPYNGQLPYSCYGDTHKRLFSNDAYMNCSMNGGASGGPWFRTMISENLGYVFAVTSRRSTSGTKRLYARPNTQAVKDMFDEMK